MSSALGAPPAESLRALAPLLAEVGELKRLRSSGRARSAADRLFLRAWGEVAAGADPERVALAVTAAAVAATRLGDIDGAVLMDAGLAPDEAMDVLGRAIGEWEAVVPDAGALRRAVALRPEAPPAPAFAAALADQPRAGPTRPGRGRLVLEPAEGHAGHCLAVAVGGVLLAPAYGAAPGHAFLAGLAHHLHNAHLPDAGFAGEELLGDHLAPVMARLRARALEELAGPARAATEDALAAVADAGTPEGRAHHAADVLDRVLEVGHHVRRANVTIGAALGEMELVHAGPLQSFQLAVVEAAGIG